MAESYGLSKPLHDPVDANVDIVFVHGLGGHRQDTWTWEGQGRKIFWPQDLLPQVCPTARILSFGYNADFAHFYPFYGPKAIAGQLTIEDHTTQLIQDLIALRETTESSDRRLLFVAHSLGGLICANMLSRHHGVDAAASQLAEKVMGVVFLGTPFEGSSKAKWGSRALTLLNLVSTTQRENTRDLEERSAKLAGINDAFQKRIKVRDRAGPGLHLEVACFFEQYGMYFGGKKVLIVPKESACLPGVDSQSIQAHHTDMCKFEDEDREGYQNIALKLSQWVSSLANPEYAMGVNNQLPAISLGDVAFKEKIDNNKGVVMGHALSTATDGVRVTGSTTTNYYHSKSPPE